MQRPSGLESQTMINNAKYEYLYILHEIMNDVLYNRFKSIYDNSEDLYEFQQNLKQTKEWNKTQINSVVQDILNDIDWDTSDFDDLITAIFIGHSMTLTSINLKNEPDNFKLRVPSNETLVHTILQSVAQKLFFDPGMFKTDTHENYDKVSNIIEKCIKKSIISLLPIKELVKYSIENKDSNENVFDIPEENNKQPLVPAGDSDSDFFPEENENKESESPDEEIKNIQYGDHTKKDNTSDTEKEKSTTNEEPNEAIPVANDKENISDSDSD